MRGGLRLRLTLLSTALLSLVGALMLALAYLLVGRVVAALPRFPPGTPVQIDGRITDAAAFSDQVVRQGRETVLLVGSIAFPLLVVAGAMVSWVLIGRTLRPLSVLTSAARGLSEASLDRRIQLPGPRDEVAELADTFDDMLGRLQAAFDAERRFVANASHELRTPLSVIRTEVDVTLADPHVDAEDLRRMADVVREATDRADRLLTSLLFLARTQGSGISERRDVDLAALVEPALRAVAGERAERRVTVAVDARPAPVSGDPALLERVVGNLVENAVRHNVVGGELAVSTAVEGDRAVVRVRSGGAEIDPATVSQLFEPFRQGDRARTGHRGSGLGLSIVRAVVAAHDGTVTAAPVPGGGLAVRVELPVRG
ncbi:HAMP domain-containing sensor histidine kinase [Nakamurella endophytica]|uniref:HAMP domain-containing sensor histidine kinase n=1 Tax=Nakamurella endophytica TaxID=1748367 RepID=UPI001E4E5291|nr:HAMP domain-containing sensor histidine kinase [Nakamurella endophytica]